MKRQGQVGRAGGVLLGLGVRLVGLVVMAGCRDDAATTSTSKAAQQPVATDGAGSDAAPQADPPPQRAAEPMEDAATDSPFDLGGEPSYEPDRADHPTGKSDSEFGSQPDPATRPRGRLVFDPSQSPSEADDAPAREHTEVVDFVAQKGWQLYRDRRISDNRSMVFLIIQDPNDRHADLDLTAEEYAMIARSRTVQAIDLRRVKTTDEGLKTLAEIPQLETLLIVSELVTDQGLRALARCPLLSEIILVAFTQGVTDDGIRELARLPRLERLSIMGTAVNGSAFEPFAASGQLKTLKLEVMQNFADEGATYVAELPGLVELEISVTSDELTTAGIRSIVETRLPPHFKFPSRLIDDGLLEMLVARGWLFGEPPPGLKTTRPTTAAGVTWIDLAGSAVTDRGLQAILPCTNVTSLLLKGTKVTDEGIKQLAAFEKLKQLSLSETQVGSAGLQALAKLPIEELDLRKCRLVEADFQAIGQIATLKELDLSSVPTEPAWLAHLVGLKQLELLTLFSTGVDDRAVEPRIQIPSLKTLFLSHTKLTDEGYKQLATLPKLWILAASETGVSEEVINSVKLRGK